MKPAAFPDLVSCLTADQTPRVWSLLVTVFGELAQDDASKISGALLGTLTALMGIKPEAMRTALHRLRKDGWIDSEADGRRRRHFLTDWGRAQSAAATPRIYDLTPVPSPAFLLVCDPAAPAPDKTQSTAWITSSIAITTQRSTCAHRLATPLSPDTPLPAWMQRKICTDATDQLTTQLATRLQSLCKIAPDATHLSAVEIAALRVLIVHGWRRVILRTPALPDFVFSPSWGGTTCRLAVNDLLTRYPPQDLATLEDAVHA